MIHKLTVKTGKREEIIDITELICNTLKQESINSGLCVVYTPHTTTAVTTNENYDPSVKEDITRFLKATIPVNWGFSHAEGNSDAHLKASLLGARELYIIENGQIVLGTWQGILFCEFDGPRNRTIFVKFIKEEK